MPTLADWIAKFPDTAITGGGVLIGMLFGAIVHRTNYCTMGAITDWWIAGNKERLGAVALAAATAVVGAQLLDAYTVTDLSKSIYLAPRINWLGAIFGGFIFGAGMVYAGGCPSRTLVRTGSGDLRGIISLMIMALAAYATISGVLASLRIGIDTTTAIDLKRHTLKTQSLDDILALAGLQAGSARWIATALVAAPLAVFAFTKAQILNTPRNLIAGLTIGALAIAGWALTGLASDEFALAPVQPASLSFVKPVGDAIDWLERSTALGMPSFGAASVFGVLAGACLTSLATGGARLSGFADRQDVIRHILGGAAMGIGGVLALGCSIGQGVTGISTLAIQS
ncbi:MAG TPA: YeeE/YedE family protein, partial [Hyphomicrobium sp.]|nr:YeeE/YedE family protein [Hyphomicrobium sp.]